MQWVLAQSNSARQSSGTLHAVDTKREYIGNGAVLGYSTHRLGFHTGTFSFEQWSLQCENCHVYFFVLEVGEHFSNHIFSLNCSLHRHRCVIIGFFFQSGYLVKSFLGIAEETLWSAFFRLRCCVCICICVSECSEGKKSFALSVRALTHIQPKAAQKGNRKFQY